MPQHRPRDCRFFNETGSFCHDCTTTWYNCPHCEGGYEDQNCICEGAETETHSDLQSVKNALLEVNAPTADSPADQIRALYAVMWDDIVRLAAKGDEAQAEVERITHNIVQTEKHAQLLEQSVLDLEAEVMRFRKAVHTRSCQKQSAYNVECICGADEHQRDLRILAYRRGAEDMREVAAQWVADFCASGKAQVIRALPIPIPKDEA